MRREITFALGAALSLFICSMTSWAADKISFTPGWLFYGKDVGYFASIEGGNYKREGIDITIVPGKGATDVVNRVAGKVDRFGMAGLGAVVPARVRNIPIKLISMYHDKGLEGIYTLKGSGIKKPKDLEGRTIGGTATGATEILFPAVALANGIDLNKVKWINVSPPAKIPSLLAGKVDAIVTFHNSFPSIVKGAQKHGKEVVSLLYADWGVDIYTGGLIAREEDLAEHGDLVRRFLKATYEGTAWAIDHPEEALRLFMKRNPLLNAEIAGAEWKITIDHLLTPLARKHGLGYIDKAKMTRTIDIVSKAMKVKSVPAEDMYTLTYLPKVFPKRVQD